VDGQIQPLLFDAEKILPFRINLLPLVHLFDYEIMSEAVLNLVGNTLMFVPVGIVYPIVYKKLNTHAKVLAAGAGFSLTIEILQLPFFDRVSDVDDLILNSLGYALGYLIYLGAKRIIDKKG
jgi:glycopeptide antibiotics resistance protein